MTPFNRQPDEADRLDDYLDDLAMGEPAPRSTIEPDLAQTVARVNRSGAAEAPPHLKAAIWEDLMSATYAGDAGTMAAPIDPGARIDRSRSGWLPTFTPDKSRSSRFALVAAAVAVFALIGGLVYSAMQPGGPSPTPPGGNYAFFAPGDATPIAWPEDTVFPPAEDCTVPVVRVGEITAILQSSYEGWERGSSQRDFPLTPADNVPSAPPLPDGEVVDAETTAAIEEVYYTYIACRNAGSIRQEFWLMSNDGIARALAPNGRPTLGMIGMLAVEPTPVPGNAVPLYPIEELRLLPDGRVALIYQTLGSAPVEDQYINYLIFVEHNGSWYIDDRYCGTCG